MGAFLTAEEDSEPVFSHRVLGGNLTTYSSSPLSGLSLECSFESFISVHSIIGLLAGKRKGSYAACLVVLLVRAWRHPVAL